MENSNEELKTLKSDIVEFTFYCNEMKIAVLNKTMFDPKNEKNAYYLGKLVDHDDFEELVALTEEEYEVASKRYNAILEMFSGDKE